jgi:hypothetical protein
MHGRLVKSTNVRAGQMKDSNVGFRQAVECFGQRILLQPDKAEVDNRANAAAQGPSFVTTWTSPPCCSVSPASPVEFFVTAATGAHKHFLQSNYKFKSDGCNCSGSMLFMVAVSRPLPKLLRRAAMTCDVAMPAMGALLIILSCSVQQQHTAIGFGDVGIAGISVQ